jgi:hypothetical protein
MVVHSELPTMSVHDMRNVSSTESSYPERRRFSVASGGDIVSHRRQIPTSAKTIVIASIKLRHCHLSPLEVFWQTTSHNSIQVIRIGALHQFNLETLGPAKTPNNKGIVPRIFRPLEVRSISAVDVLSWLPKYSSSLS